MRKQLAWLGEQVGWCRYHWMPDPDAGSAAAGATL